MKWLKHGVVWAPDGSHEWAKTHATCPTPVWLPDGTLRVYVQSRAANNVGRVGFVDLDPADPRTVLRVAERPVLDIGEPGCFDDNGVFQTSVVADGNGRYLMYYVGFELCHHVRYRLFTGVAVSEDNGLTFQRAARTPALDRSPNEAFFRCGPYVLRDDDGYQMWYVSGNGWTDIDGKTMPIYDLKTIRSTDGIHWPGEGTQVLALDSSEHGFGRPFVVPHAGGWKMFYSIRKRKPCAYRLGFATSDDGRTWTRRDDELGLDVSSSGWDSESVEYTALLETAGKTWILYNGNDFGGTGFGIAELLEP